MFSSDTTQVSSGGYQISRSLRFNRADSTSLSRTFSTAGTSQTTSTLSFWVKRSDSEVNTRYMMFASYDGSSGQDTNLGFYDESLKLNFGRGTSAGLTTTQVFRDYSAWYHIVVVMDSTQATSSNRMKLYVNGSQITSFSSATYPSQNATCNWMSANGNNRIGSSWDGSNNSNQYLTEINFIDGQALTPSSFGETNAQTGVWQPKAYSGSYGTNGFYLNFSDNSNTTAATLGKDYSGNGNNWTPNNFSVTAGAGNDSLVDSPTSYGTDTGVGGTVRGNYCTWNPLSTGGGVVLSNGNLTFSKTSSTCIGAGTIFVSSGKWYFEYTCTSSVNMVGVIRDTDSPRSMDYVGFSANSYGYYYNGNKFNNNANAGYGSSYTTNDVIGIALDMDAGTIAFYKNGTSQGTAYSGLSGNFTVASGDNVSVSGELNCGQRPFAYTAPSGFKALCTQNLPTPTIGATTATLANKYYNAVTYTGNGSSQTISTVGFQADWVWVKSRSASYSGQVQDAVRGFNNALTTDTTSAEFSGSANYGYVSNLTSSGYDVATGSIGAQHINASGVTYVAWNWKANGSGSTNTAGSITSTVSANTTSGFSVVTYTGTGSAATIGHGLGVAPSMLIFKSRSNGSENWNVYHKSLGASTNILLNSTIAAFTDAAFLNATAPTSTVLSVGGAGSTGTNAGSNTYVCYAFAEVAGYSKFGSYTGNGSTDGPFVYCGFRPAYVMVKSSSNGGTSWNVGDGTRNPSNVANLALFPNRNSAEDSASALFDLTSNGFKLRTSGGDLNASGYTYIFAAFAEVPQKFSLAR